MEKAIKGTDTLDIGIYNFKRVIVTGEDVECILESFLRSDISCEWVDYVYPIYINGRESANGMVQDFLARKCDWIIECDEGDMVLSEDNLLKGFGNAIANLPSKYFEKSYKNRLTIDATWYDSVLADGVIQFALFDELIYG